MKNFILAVALLLGVASVGRAGEAACETKCVTRCTPVRSVVAAALNVAERVVAAPFKMLDCLCDKSTKPVCTPVCQPAVMPCEPVVKPCEPAVKPCEPIRAECVPVCQERRKPLRKALSNLKAKCKAPKCECVVTTATKQCGC